MHRAILSGITGHLGEELAGQLSRAGVAVHGLTRREVPALGADHPAYTLHRVDGRTETLIGILEAIKPDVVFHLASMYRREHESADVGPLIEANVLLGAQLLEAARRVGPVRFVAAGSFFQHFDSDEYRALNLYAATKQAFEDLLEYYVDAFGLSAAVLTLYEIYSERDPRTKLMRVIANASMRDLPLNLPADEFWIDLVHVEDAAAAFLRAAELLASNDARAARPHRYCVCSGRQISGSELVSLFEEIARHPVRVRRGAYPQPVRAIHRPWRGQSVPGWTPRVMLEEGIRRMLGIPR